GLPGTHGMGEEGIATAHDAPHRIALVGVEGDVWAHAGKDQVGAVETAQPEGVIRVVVETDQALGAVRIAEDPGAKPLLDGFLLVACSQGALRLASMSPGSTSSGWTARRASTLRA